MYNYSAPLTYCTIMESVCRSVHSILLWHSNRLVQSIFYWELQFSCYLYDYSPYRVMLSTVMANCWTDVIASSQLPTGHQATHHYYYQSLFVGSRWWRRLVHFMLITVVRPTHWMWAWVARGRGVFYYILLDYKKPLIGRTLSIWIRMYARMKVGLYMVFCLYLSQNIICRLGWSAWNLYLILYMENQNIFGNIILNKIYVYKIYVYDMMII